MTRVSAPRNGIAVVGSHGTVTYTHDGSATTADSFAYTVEDPEGRTASAVVTVTIIPEADGGVDIAPVPDPPVEVNDAPVFVPGPDQVVAEDTAAQTVPDWATAITTGPPDESGQSITFTVTVDYPTLFSEQPALSPTGTLTYTPAPDANGTATLTITAHDDGGVADGGNDTSTPQTAHITITPVNDAPVAIDDAYYTPRNATLDQPVLTGVLANDGDVDGDLLTVHSTPVTPAAHGSLTLRENGSFDYVPDPAFTGVDSFAYRIDDGTGQTAIATVRITVTSVPDGTETAFINRANAARSADGKAALRVYWVLTDDARAHSNAMKSKGELFLNNAHSEIVGVGPGVDSLFEAFMASPTHRAKILGPYDYIGVGVAYDDGGIIWVTMFFIAGPDDLPEATYP